MAEKARVISRRLVLLALGLFSIDRAIAIAVAGALTAAVSAPLAAGALNAQREQDRAATVETSLGSVDLNDDRFPDAPAAENPSTGLALAAPDNASDGGGDDSSSDSSDDPPADEPPPDDQSDDAPPPTDDGSDTPEPEQDGADEPPPTDDRGGRDNVDDGPDNDVQDDAVDTPDSSTPAAPTPTEAPNPTSVPTSAPTTAPDPLSTSGPVATTTPVPTATRVPTATSTPAPTSTRVPTATSTPVPTATGTRVPTATSTPTAIATRVPTATSTPTATATRVPTATSTPTATATRVPTATSTPTATATSTPTPTSTPVPQVDSITARITQSIDDAEERLPGQLLITGSSDLDFTRRTRIGLRYSLCVPAGATISQASITFTAEESSAEPTSATFWGQRKGDTASFVEQPIVVRVRTQSEAEWVMPEFETNQRYTSPDLSAIVSEIVAGDDWTGCGNMVFIIEAVGNRGAWSFDAEADPQAPPLSPVLNIKLDE